MSLPRKKEYEQLNQKQLKARASFADEWLQAGRIDRAEANRLQLDYYNGRDRGPVRWLKEVK